jgi:hypothetical protein
MGTVTIIFIIQSYIGELEKVTLNEGDVFPLSLPEIVFV